MGGDHALRGLGPKLGETKVPVFFLGVTHNPRYYFKEKIPPNITGILERPSFDRKAMGNIKKLLPHAQKALLLLGTSITAKVIMGDFAKQNRYAKGAITLETRLHSTFEEWRYSVKTAKERGYDLIIVGLYDQIKDKNNELVKPDEIIKWTSRNTPLPPFGFWAFSIGQDKAIGATIIDGYSHGVISAKQILGYIKTGRKPMLKNPQVTSFMYNQNMLEKWKLSMPESLQKKSIQR